MENTTLTPLILVDTGPYQLSQSVLRLFIKGKWYAAGKFRSLNLHDDGNYRLWLRNLFEYTPEDAKSSDIVATLLNYRSKTHDQSLQVRPLPFILKDPQVVFPVSDPKTALVLQDGDNYFAFLSNELDKAAIELRISELGGY